MLTSVSNSSYIPVVLISASHDNDGSNTKDAGSSSNLPCIFIVKICSMSGNCIMSLYSSLSLSKRYPYGYAFWMLVVSI